MNESKVCFLCVFWGFCCCCFLSSYWQKITVVCYRISIINVCHDMKRIENCCYRKYRRQITLVGVRYLSKPQLCNKSHFGKRNLDFVFAVYAAPGREYNSSEFVSPEVYILFSTGGFNHLFPNAGLHF